VRELAYPISVAKGSSFFHREARMADITAGQLQAGDVLLYHGTAFISRLIRLFDGGAYSHASIYDGAQVVEALGQGITADAVATSVSGAAYVDVYRFVTDQGTMLGPGLTAQPVVNTIKSYLQKHDRYAYEEILLLAVLCSSRRISGINAVLAMVLRNLLDSAAALLAKFVAGGKQPMICSEFVYRCYFESGSAYFIKVRGADVAAAAAAAVIAATVAPAPVVAAAALASDPSSDAVAAFQADAAEFLVQYEAASLQAPKNRAAKGKRAKRQPLAPVIAAAVPDFVTPRDLQRSPNLIKIGTLRT
jgi:hypothetical protein